MRGTEAHEQSQNSDRQLRHITEALEDFLSNKYKPHAGHFARECGCHSLVPRTGRLTLRVREPREFISYDAVLLFGLFLSQRAAR